MPVRNLLKAGDFVTIIPIGIPVTLQYRSTGNLEAVWIGLDFDEKGTIGDGPVKSKFLYSEVVKKQKVPMHVSTNGGTLYVQGTIYTGVLNQTTGLMPKAQIEATLKDIEQGVNFNFFAGNVISTSMIFAGSAQIRSWIQIHGFHDAPGYIVPQGDFPTALKRLINDNTAFKYDLVTGYFVFRGTTCKHKFIGNKLQQIENLEIYLDSCGYVKCKVEFYGEAKPLHISYQEMTAKQLYSNDYVIMNAYNKIVSRYPIPGGEVKSSKYTCPFCGRVYVMADEFSRCPDTHCFSRMYEDLVHFLLNISLNPITYTEYIEYVEDGTLSKFSDILLCPQYRDAVIELTLYKLLDAVIPVPYLRNREALWNLCIKCNHSWDSVSYYIDHPSAIISDLHIDSPELVSWLSDIENANTIKEIIQYSNIVISNNIKKFDFSPIFRGRKIYLTGRFNHGDIPEVEAILRSYAAEIVDSDDADCVILGDIPENINGVMVNKFKAKNVPIFTESQFFNQYDIDSDLS